MRMWRKFAQHQHARRATWDSYMANNRVTASAESDKLCPHNCCKMLFLHEGCLCSVCMGVACGPVCASHFRRSYRTFEIEPVLSVASMRSPEPPTRHIPGRSHKQGNALLDSPPPQDPGSYQMRRLGNGAATNGALPFPSSASNPNGHKSRREACSPAASS